MARIGISITKTTPFRGAAQEFSNVYHYDRVAGLPSASEADALIDELAAFEKTIHSTAVTFIKGRCWSQVGTPAGNQMISQKTLSGTGSAATDTALDKERAFLFRIHAGTDSRGIAVYLRKWYHSCGVFPGCSSTGGGISANTSAIPVADRNTMVSNMQTIGAIGGGTEDWKICSKGGRFPTAGAGWSAHAYLEHRQLGNMWRAN